MTEADKLYLSSLEDAVRILAIAYSDTPGSSQIGNFLLDSRRHLIQQMDRISAPVLEAR